MTPTKEKALAALLTCKTRHDAAMTAGITEKTLRTWLDADKEFRQRYNQACSDIFSDATRQAQQGLETAITVFRTVMENEDETTRNRLQAARYMADYALRLTEANDILERLNELERDEYD